MEIERKEFIKNLDEIIRLVKTMQVAIEEEPEKLNLKDIEELTNIIENRLVNTKNLLDERQFLLT